jgi:predicted nucleic acid-binding protein
VVTDANVLINLMHVSRLGLLRSIPNHEFVVPQHVREEVTILEQRVALDAEINEGWLRLEASAISEPSRRSPSSQPPSGVAKQRSGSS